MQRFTFYHNGETHTRTYVNSQWYDWFKVNALSLPLSVANGGTGKTTGADAANSLINALSTGTSTPQDADYYVSQSAGGGTTTTTYYRRPMSALWSYMKGKIGLDSNGVLPISKGGTGKTTAADACASLGAVKKSGDTMTGPLYINFSSSNPCLFFRAGDVLKGAVYSATASSSASGGLILRGWNADASAYKDLNLTYANNMAVPISNGGTGATSAAAAVQNLFSSSSTITSYPTKPGIYRTTGTKVCTNSLSTLTGYGVLVIFQAVYGMHFYLDSNGTLIYGYSGDTFGQPSTWNRVTYT